MTVRAIAVVALLMAAAPMAAAASSHTSAAFLEAEETRIDPIQKNCVRAAWTGIEGDGCPFQTITKTMPAPLEMIRMFDLVYMMSGVPMHATDALSEPAGPTTATSIAGTSQSRGANLHRASNGEIPDVIWPGVGHFEGWYGHWNDQDGDGVILHRYEGEYTSHTPDNEWNLASTPLIVAYIDPGPHPQVANNDRPRETTPDLVFQSLSTYGYYTSRHGDVALVGGAILFVDGNLLQPVRIAAVSDPLLVPDGQESFTARPDSLVDVDHHAAVAAGSIGDLYEATVASTVNTIGSPSIGNCPGGCRAGPVPLGPLATAETREAFESVWVRYPREWHADSGSTGALHGLAYRDAYHAWIDLIPRWGPGTAESSMVGRPGPLAGRAADGSQAALPGYVSFEMRLGVWRDQNADGFVGAANPTDPYEGGSRPLPDDYFNAGAEYFATQAHDPATMSPGADNLRLTITPLDTWGPLGAFSTTSGAWTMLFVNSGSQPPLACSPVPPPNGFCVGDPLAYHLTGTEPLNLELRKDSVVAGRFAATRNLFLPQGTLNGGFMACTADIGVKFQDAGTEVAEVVHDCDVIEQLAS